MNKFELTRGEGRTRVSLSAYYMGGDLVLCIYNQHAHIGAVAVGEYDPDEKRGSTSVITRRGHKDDAVAQKVAHSVSTRTRKPACVIAGIHLDDITREEIDQILRNTTSLIEEFLSREL